LRGRIRAIEGTLVTEPSIKDFILTTLKIRISDEQLLWLQGSMSAAAAGDEETILSSYTAASRKLGKIALSPDEAERSKLRELGADLNLDRWALDECGRAAILLSLAGNNNYADIVQHCYDLGDSREQQSWLRSLSLLPKSELFLETAIDSCRTNIIPVFEGIACENRYPSLHFPELNFNQMVLKCLFNGIGLARVIGLRSRLNPELSRMAEHYAQEREAAGRQVPHDISLAQGASR